MLYFYALIVLALSAADVVLAGVHPAPIIIKAREIYKASRFPLSTYQLFRTGKDGAAVPIPFQIDEIDSVGDFILDQGAKPNGGSTDGVFNGDDELVFMGDDVGPAKAPIAWPGGRAPTITYEIRFWNQSLLQADGKPRNGAVYLGIYFKAKNLKSQKKYVIFDAKRGLVSTSRYFYHFDPKNHLIVKDILMSKRGEITERSPLVASSTFYMKADLKYFLTLEANHRTIDSRIEAFKSGPVRTIVRVTFFYTFLKMNFEVGMYTEISFFSNSVVLPTVLYNPVEGSESLNFGSHFYYGFSFMDNPNQYVIDTNMEAYPPVERSIIGSLFAEAPKPKQSYHVTASKSDQLIHVEVTPSAQMLDRGNVPYLYLKNKSAKELSVIDNDKELSIEDSPVNVGMYFDLTKFVEGEQKMAFKLFFDNKFTPELLSEYKAVSSWDHVYRRL